MKNAATADATATSKKRSISEEAEEPPAKRSNNAAAASVFQSRYGLTPELIGHIARFLPMGTPDMMRLLLRVGPDVATAVRKMYLTGNEYYLWYSAFEGTFGWNKTKELIGYWMDHNKEAWEKRCLGKKDNDNVRSVMLTPEQFRSFGRETFFGLNYVKSFDEAALDGESLKVMKTLFKNNSILFLTSVGDRDVDDGREMTEEHCDSLINAAPVNKEGNICVRFMRSNDALFAYPRFYLKYDLVDVLRYSIDKKIIEPGMMIKYEVCIYGSRYCIGESLLYLAVTGDSPSCFRYLLSLPGTDINAVAFSREDEEHFPHYENIIHICLSSNDICPRYLEDIIAHSNVDLNARNTSGETAFCQGCNFGDDLVDHNSTITKLRLLLEAGADARIVDDQGRSPLSHIEVKISNIEASEEDQNDELVEKLQSLRTELQRATIS